MGVERAVYFLAGQRRCHGRLDQAATLDHVLVANTADCQRLGKALVNSFAVLVGAVVTVVNRFGSARVHFQVVVDVCV